MADTSLYQVVAPLVLIKNTDGVTRYVYQGAFVEAPADTVADFVEAGLLVELDEAAFIASPGEHVVDPELSGGGADDDELPVVDLSQLKGERPPHAANKEAWVDYAELNGIARVDAEKLNKADLIGLFTAPE